MAKRKGKKKPKKIKWKKHLKNIFSRKKVKKQQKKRAERERKIGSIPGRLKNAIPKRERVIVEWHE